MTKWTICPECEGDGSHALALGVIDRADWSNDELADYFGGAYDRTCDCCKGAGKILTSEWERISAERAAWDEIAGYY